MSETHSLARGIRVSTMKWLSLLVVALTLGCSVRVGRDRRPRFTIDRTNPFRIELGRGSGLDGLETVRIDETGRVVLHRMKAERRDNTIFHTWEVGTLQLNANELANVLKSIESNGLMGLHKVYDDTYVHDGTQWVLWMKQGEHEKSVYFNNHFPKAIKEFARELDATLENNGRAKVAWQPTQMNEVPAHDRELWDSIRR